MVKKGSRGHPAKERDISCFVAWVPSTVLYQVMPEAVELFNTGKGRRGKGLAGSTGVSIRNLTIRIHINSCIEKHCGQHIEQAD